MSSHPRILIGLAGLALTACGGGFEDYYPDRSDPTVSDVTPASESGNVGGETITISGSGFGDDPAEVIVLIDNHNAEILSVSDSEIVAVSPPGPITGGPVDLLVATETGYTLRDASDGLYRYGAGDFTENGEFYEDQVHYIQISNLFSSCYGGIGAGIGGCEQSAFNGATGIDGQAEFLRFSYPRLHTIRTGWLTAFDAAETDWAVSSPDAVFPSGIDDLRRRLPTEADSNVAFSIKNPAFEGQEVCVDLTAEVSQSPSSTPCGDTTLYDIGVINWCEVQDSEDGGQYEYRPDFPVNHDFFQSSEPGAAVPVALDVPGLGLAEYDVVLPPVVDLDAEVGFGDDDTLPWAISSMDSCSDTTGDGQGLLDDDGIVLTWTPVDPEIYGAGVEVNSYLHVSMTSVDFAWYGLETVGVRVSRQVPDAFETYEDGEGNTLSRLAIPNDVLYQVPTPNSNWSGTDDFSGTGYLGEYDDNPRYLFMEVYRVTDYKIQTDEGPLVLSYSTGELTILGWTNPMSRTRSCLDCVDDDGDGWTDDRDPDCDTDYGGDGRDELNSTSEYTCNDGLDNNGDGLIDADDPLCENGWDGETTCGDRIDNDNDGWIDALDPDCIGGDAFTQEDGAVTGGTCNDGIDNDGDGWIDSEDPGCPDGTANEIDGYTGTACNDGIDNDLHGDPDHLDLYCILEGADSDSEVSPAFSACRNSRDDDSDGFFDLNDPDCEIRPFNRERETTATEDFPIVPTCYDGVDNDGNGLSDADDPSCWNPAYDYAADGFFAEGVDRGTGCTDGLDEDGDGWIDGLDPDCQAGSADTQDEIGLGDTQCNDGIDNDGDGLIDAEDDSYCKRGSQNFEGPS